MSIIDILHSPQGIGFQFSFGSEKTKLVVSERNALKLIERSLSVYRRASLVGGLIFSSQPWTALVRGPTARSCQQQIKRGRRKWSVTCWSVLTLIFSTLFVEPTRNVTGLFNDRFVSWAVDLYSYRSLYKLLMIYAHHLLSAAKPCSTISSVRYILLLCVRACGCVWSYSARFVLGVSIFQGTRNLQIGVFSAV